MPAAKKLSQEARNQLISDYYKYTLKELEKKYKISTPLIYREVKDLLGDKFKINKNKKYTVDTSYFEKINTPNKAYFLGLLYADGNINDINLRINLQERDKEILEKLRLDIDYTGPLTKYNKKPPRQNQYCLSIKNIKLIEDLKNIGVTYNKTQHIDFPKDKIPSELIIHFMRGFFDGDGCISIPKCKKYMVVFTITCLESMAIGFKNYLESIGIGSKIYKFNDNKYNIKELRELKIGRKKDIFKLMSLFYKNTDMFIKRKYDKYKEAFLDKELHLYENYTANRYTGNEGKGFSILKLDKFNNIIKEYKSSKQAARDSNIRPPEILRLCRKYKNRKDYNKNLSNFYCFKEDYNLDYNIIINSASKNRKKILQLDMNDNIIKEWDYIAQVSGGGFDPPTVTNVCRGKRGKTHKGYKWIYKL